MGFIIKTVLLVIGTWLAIVLSQLIWFVGFGRVVYYHAPGPCRVVEGIGNGSEDIQVLPNGFAFITSGLVPPGLGTHEHFQYVEGRIYLFDFNHPDRKPKVLKIRGRDEEDPLKLNPHGLSLWQTDSGITYVYVVNHLPGEEVVDKFRFDEKTETLHHKARISARNNEAFGSVNDLVAVGEDQFYFTNLFHDKLLPSMAEVMLRLYWGSVGFYDGHNSTIVEQGLLLPNGINMSPDSKYIYLSHNGDKDLRIYTRQSDNTLTLKESIYVGTLMDNLEVEPDTGDIWTGCHPDLSKAMPHYQDPYNIPAPSQVLRIQVKDGTFQQMTEVYSEEGQHVSASSIAAHYKGAMLVGTVYHNMLYCQVLHK